MTAFDHRAATRSCRSFGMVESGAGLTHILVDPGSVTRVAAEGVARFPWSPRALCGLTPWPRWSRLSHCGDRICRNCLSKWARFLWTFARLNTEAVKTDPSPPALGPAQ